MGKEIRLNAFDMNCVGHQSPGLWRHPRDRSATYKDLEYWSELALILEKGKFDGLFIADVLGVYDVFRDFADLVVPELQKRGRSKKNYQKGTLREKLFNSGPKLPDEHPAGIIRKQAFAATVAACPTS